METYTLIYSLVKVWFEPVDNNTNMLEIKNKWDNYSMCNNTKLRLMKQHYNLRNMSKLLT